MRRLKSGPTPCSIGYLQDAGGRRAVYRGTPRSRRWRLMTASRCTSSAPRILQGEREPEVLFTSFESYDDLDCYHYTAAEPAVAEAVTWYAWRAFDVLRCRDYADSTCGSTPRLSPTSPMPTPAPPLAPTGSADDRSAATAWGQFSRILASLMTKHARRIYAPTSGCKPLALPRIRQISEYHCGPAVLQMLLGHAVWPPIRSA